MATLIKEVKRIRHSLGCSQTMLAQIVGVEPRTITRWEHNENIPHPLAIEKIRKIEEFSQKLLEVFDQKEAREWLNTPNSSLGGRTPFKEIMYNGNQGIEKVVDLLGAIEWGIIT